MGSLNKKSITFILYDWATSPITTIHTTFIFSVYFVEKIAVENGPFLWGFIIAIAAMLTAFMGPILGSYADKKRKRKLILFFLTMLGGFSTMLLWFAKPGTDYLVFASISSCISIFTMEVVFVLYNSLLSSSTNKKNYGILSGLSWGAGYVAGIISLLLCLVLFIFPEKLMFGLTKENGENIRACMLFISIWMMVFAIPLFIFTSEPEKNKSDHLKDTIFVFTGTLNLLNRNDAKKKVELSGGTSKNSLTKNTSFLVTGNKTGSKVEKAKNMGIPILNEDEFIKLINNG